MSTVAMYWPNWLTCSVCGLTDPDVKPTSFDNGAHSLCKNDERCRHMRRGEPLGGKKWDVVKALSE